ncbi:unnamed protein product [Microthlaspi erraticum]|uniref:Uncharacterized protein n=1 Tax=Microthlaspi erraticum TaxID=1685480 RepID=A0A6D2ID41_9BRAS|nr:unnamed protein product [Microthlaspi erraticum]
MKIIWSLCLFVSLSYSVLAFASPVRHLCRPDQKDALWEFKSEFYIKKWTESDTTTEKWRNNTDCCSWDGVSCDPKKGVVVELDLSFSYLNGALRSNSSLFRLQHLQNLDLYTNNISGILPDSIGNLKFLSVLSLGDCNFVGKIPSSLGNLSYLTNLDLSFNGFTGELPDWMRNLSELTSINLGFNLLEGLLPSNMSSLSKLESFHIAGNSFHGSVPSSLFMIPSLTELRLERNHLSGSPEIGNISSPSKFKMLSLGDNNFGGPIPESISKLIGLELLDLSLWNTGRGIVDFNIFLPLKSLTLLHLSYLNSRSMVDLILFSQLISLGSLRLSGINLRISPSLHLPSTIEHLHLSSCNISDFPKFLQNQTRLMSLDISANRIEGQVPEWFWSLPELWYVNISHNSFSGFEGSPDVIQKSANLSILDISSNIFRDLPLLPKALRYFLGSENGFSGEIPMALCELVVLDTLFLSNNNFSGSIPQCFSATLWVLHLQNNSLSGILPDKLLSDSLRSLDVGHNRLSGQLPKSLINCTQLQHLNVENNMFNDTFPFCLRLLSDLQILVLRSNQFHGPLSSPRDSLTFPKLRIFDISQNRFTGVLPSDYFACWNALSSEYYLPIRLRRYVSEFHIKSVSLTNKGLKMELVGSGFRLYKTIDLSGNRLEGDIPESIGLLKGLIVLNMSNNAFTSRIPSSLGNLTKLESLDLSHNRLSGKIPPELVKLTFLSRMNFSHNMLEGPLPQGTQIQSQNSSVC